MSVQPKSVAISAFLRSSVFAFSSAMLINVSGFVFHAIVSRWLGTTGYSLLYSVIALYTLASLPAQFLTPVVLKLGGELHALGDDVHLRGLLKYITRLSSAIGIAYVLLGTLGATNLGQFFHLAPFLISLTFVIAAFGLYASLLKAFCQSIHRFEIVTYASMSEGGFKLLFLFLAFWVGTTISIAEGSFFSGVMMGLIAIAIPVWSLYKITGVQQVHINLRRVLITSGGAASLAFALIAMGFADVLIVKHFFNASDASLYSMASLGAKILFYFVGFIPSALLPHVAYRHAKGETSKRILFLSLGFIAVVGLVAAIGYPYGGPILLHILGGDNFGAAYPLMATYGIAMIFLAMTNAVATYAIAKHSMYFALPLLIVTIATLVTMYVSHPSLASIVMELAVGTFAMFVTVSIFSALAPLCRSLGLTKAKDIS